MLSRISGDLNVSSRVFVPFANCSPSLNVLSIICTPVSFLRPLKGSLKMYLEVRNIAQIILDRIKGLSSRATAGLWGWGVARWCAILLCVVAIWQVAVA